MTTPDSRQLARQQRIDELHRCLPARTALLVIDMQHGFLDEGASLEVPKGRAIVPTIARLIAACRAKKVPVIFTEFVYCEAVPCLRGDPFGPEHLPAPAPGSGAAHGSDQPTGFGYPSDNCLVDPRGRDLGKSGPESAKTIDALAPRPDEVVVQAHTYDKFYGTPLDLALRSRSLDRLLLTGVTTDVCVNSTLIAAAVRNYRVTVISDAVATIEDHIQQACFTIWRNKFARVRSSKQVLAEIETI